MTIGARTSPTFKLRPCSPTESKSQENGLITANTSTVGASKRKTSDALDHPGPSAIKMIWSANRPQNTVIGTVIETVKEYPFRKYLFNLAGSSWIRDKAEKATLPIAPF